MEHKGMNGCHSAEAGGRQRIGKALVFFLLMIFPFCLYAGSPIILESGPKSFNGVLEFGMNLLPGYRGIYDYEGSLISVRVVTSVSALEKEGWSSLKGCIFPVFQGPAAPESEIPESGEQGDYTTYAALIQEGVILLVVWNGTHENLCLFLERLGPRIISFHRLNPDGPIPFPAVVE